MDIIFITNQTKLGNLGLEENFIIENQITEIDIGNNNIIHLVYDGGGQIDLANEYKNKIDKFFDEKIKNDDFFIIHHNNQSDDFNAHLTNIPSNRRFDGIHESDDVRAKYYEKLVDILDDEDAKKGLLSNELAEELKKKINEDNSLEAKLNFLHQCLTPDGLKDATLKDEWNAESEFENLKIVKDGPFGNDYLEALRSLRDKLWAS